MDDIQCTGGCACGAVRFVISGEIGLVVGCHCRTCRRTSGHYWAAVGIEAERFRLVQDKSLQWFASSDIAKRGFCGECGSSLFYRRVDSDHISVAAGALDDTAGLVLHEHIFTAEAGDYYVLDPQTVHHAGQD